MLIFPLANQLRERGRIQNAVDSMIHAVPEIGKRGIVLSPQPRSFFLAAFDKAQNLADRDRLGAFREQVPALGSAARFDEATLLQAGQNQLQKLLWNLLSASNFGDFYRLGARVLREIENGLERILPLHRNVHRWNSPGKTRD